MYQATQSSAIIVMKKEHYLSRKINKIWSCPSPNLQGCFWGRIWKGEYLFRFWRAVWQENQRKQCITASNSFGEVFTSATLLLPKQVYDNPNKLWLSAQTLKYLIGVKSNWLLRSETVESINVWTSFCVSSSYQFSSSA